MCDASLKKKNTLTVNKMHDDDEAEFGMHEASILYEPKIIWSFMNSSVEKRKRERESAFNALGV